MNQLVVILLAASVAAQDYGPVSLDSVDALTLNWNQIQWLVKDQIREVEELREEHNELYNEITRCFGNEKCLAEFQLLDMSPGQQASWTRATSLGLERQCDVKDERGSASDKSPVGHGDERTVDNGQEDQGGPGQTCCSRGGARGCRSQEGLVVVVLLLLLLL